MQTIPQHELKSYLNFALALAKKGGRVLKKYWGKLEQIDHKKVSIDLVTEADRKSEEVILKSIQKEYPLHAILSEETGLQDKEGADFLWVVDPLDGTTNYTHQYPMVSISIALLYKGEPIVGVVYNPILNELFYASKGQGSFFNHHLIKVSEIAFLNQSLLASGFPYDRRENRDNNYAEFCFLTHETQGVRRGGSAALDLAYVACGRFDGYWERGIKPWDIAAGILLIREAGGVVTNYENEFININSEKILATNGHLHSIISQHLLKIRTKFFKDL